MGQLKDFGINIEDNKRQESGLENESEDSISSAEANFAEVNYMDTADNFLRERSDLHACMGVNEALYSRRGANCRGICVDTGAQKLVAGKAQY